MTAGRQVENDGRTSSRGATSPLRFDETFLRKLEALRCYGSEMRKAPHPRSYDGVRALAQLRGVQAGLAAAEAFGVVREVVRS